MRRQVMSESSSKSAGSSRTSLYLTLSIVSVLVGGTAIGYFAVQRWMQPLTPLVVAGTALLLPLVSVNVVLALLLSDDDQTVIGALRPALFSSVAVGLVGVAASAAWLSPDIRDRALGAAADRGVRDATVRALEDPSERVVITACARLFDLGVAGNRQPLLELLDNRPGIARNCLDRASDLDKARELARVLTERWHREILSDSGTSNERACRLAGHLPNLPEAAEAGIPALLSCTLNAGEQVRSCCSKSLSEQVGTGPDLADALGNSVVRTVTERLGAPLVQASLHQLQMNDEEKARAVRLGLTSPEMKRFTAGFACAYTLSSPETNDLTRQLAAWLEDRSCQARVSNVEENIRAWHRICGHLGAALANADDPGDAICDAARRDAVVQCRSRAISRVRGAYTGAKQQFMQAQIAAGVAMKKARVSGPAGFLGKLSESDRELDGALGDIASRMNDEEFREKIKKIMVAESGGSERADAESLDNMSEGMRENFEKFQQAQENAERGVGNFDGPTGGGSFGHRQLDVTGADERMAPGGGQGGGAAPAGGNPR
jgi:hypothetical protein